MNDPQITIVGQGFAGTAVAWQLWRHGKSFQIYDLSLKHSSSLVSAGIINPLTGLRLSHNKNYTAFKQHCDEFYHSIEQILETKFYHPLRILKLLTRPEEKTAWDKKQNQYAHIARVIAPPAALKRVMKTPDTLCLEIRGALIDAGTYLNKSRAFFQQHQCLRETMLSFTTDDLPAIATPHIFCEGVHSGNNPLFPNLPFINAKGEILTIRADLNGLASTMINTDIFIVGLTDQTFRVGATYEWNDLSANPTASGRAMLENKLRQHFDFPYEIIGHRAGTRPILKDQQPLLDRHPENPHAYLLTGLASKGALYSPFLSSLWFDHVYGGKHLRDEFGLQRFEK